MTQTTSSTVLRADRDGCAVLTLNRPQVLNAISNEMVDAFEAHLDAIAKDESRALVVTGAGRAFCAGTDLKSHGEGTKQRMMHMHHIMLRLDSFPKISVAAINGIAFGGGLEVAIGCTFRIAAPGAKLGLPEIKLGLMPLYGGTAILPELIGKNRALEMVLGGEPIDAPRAHQIGLVNALSGTNESLLDDACAFAMRFGKHSKVAREALRQLSREHGSHPTLQEALEAEVALADPVINSEDAHEGVEAFLQKRAAVVRDR
jgi:enoyl-CoA hydratase/carnithine racemase